MALWGPSLSGGHVVTVAAGDPGVVAVVAQLPFLGVELRGASPRSGRVTRTLFAAAIRDAIGGVVGRAPVTIPIVGAPARLRCSPAVKTTRSHARWLHSRRCGATRWLPGRCSR